MPRLNKSVRTEVNRPRLDPAAVLRTRGPRNPGRGIRAAEYAEYADILRDVELQQLVTEGLGPRPKDQGLETIDRVRQRRVRDETSPVPGSR